MLLRQVRGTKDIIADQYHKKKMICDVACMIAQVYGFIPIETPIFEYSEIFTKTLGDDSDIIGKEMYNFTDRGGNNLILRPEFTASIVRAFITNHLKQMPSPLKLICHGPLFRYERPQKNRQRQFTQVNCEILGEPEFFADVEAISLAVNMLSALEINDKVTLELNSLGDEVSYKNYRSALIAYLLPHKEKLSQDSQARFASNPLRILDSKDERDKEIINTAPKIGDYYNNTSIDFFEKVKHGLDNLNIEYVINPYLVRGLDYYCHTIFEFTTKDLGSQNTVIAGGRYDKLVETMGGESTAAIGFAGGIERMSELMSDIATKPSTAVSIIPIGEIAQPKAMMIAHQLRKECIPTFLSVKGNFNKRIIKASCSSAIIIIGEKEIKGEVVTLKNTHTKTQECVKYNDILGKVQELLIMNSKSSN